MAENIVQLTPLFLGSRNWEVGRGEGRERERKIEKKEVAYFPL